MTNWISASPGRPRRRETPNGDIGHSYSGYVNAAHIVTAEVVTLLTRAGDKPEWAVLVTMVNGDTLEVARKYDYGEAHTVLARLTSQDGDATAHVAYSKHELEAVNV